MQDEIPEAVEALMARRCNTTATRRERDIIAVTCMRATATVVGGAAIALLALGTAGCSMQPAKPAYVGEFTGEFVDGMPLYRLPSIEVVGSRKPRDGRALDGS
jgi:hypothetical protein